MSYRHTQISPAPFRAAVLGFLGVVAVGAAASGSVAGLAVVLVTVAIVATAMAIFSRLTVAVTETAVQAQFGWGWPRRTVPFHTITTATVVRNRWWYGFGLRWFPGGSLWNVWGLDGVEFDLSEGRKLRFGTDEPEALLAALADRIPVP